MEPTAHSNPGPQAPAKAGWTVAGYGLLQGLAVTGLNMLQSFYRKDRMTTVQYPEEREVISPNFRNFPFLAYDGEDPVAGLRCTACCICEKECPPQCIYIVMDRDANGKALKRPRIFDIDVSVCMNCGICAEVCPFDSIYMDGEFEVAGEDRFEDLVFHKDRLARSTAYHAKLRPLQAAEVAAKRKADEEKKAAAAAAKAAKAKADAAAKAKAAEDAATAQARPEETKAPEA